MSEYQSVAASYPWHRKQWSDLNHRLSLEKLPHAIALIGPSSCGKRQFALAFAQRLLCLSANDGAACGRCDACNYIAAGNHPDLQVLEPEQAGRLIKIDQVRQLVEQVGKTAQQGGYRVILIDPADAMNRNAANALLKTLEEPGRDTLILLLAESAGSLLPTIRSRCQLLDFPLPPADQVLVWLTPFGKDQSPELLRLTGGRPLGALSLLESGGVEQLQAHESRFAALLEGAATPLMLSQQWQETPLIDLLEWLIPRLDRQLSSSDLSGASRFMKARSRASQLWRQLKSGANPNPQLALEDLLIDLAGY